MKENSMLSKLNGIIVKISYGFGSLPYGTTGAIMAFYLNLFFLEVVQIDPLYASIIVFAGRAWDAITDPTIGYLMIFSRWTPIGRLKPWIAFGIVPMCVMYVFLWYIPSLEWSDFNKFAYYVLVYMSFETFTTVYHLPFTALVVSLSDNLQFRDMATLSRMSFEVLGVLVGIGSHTFFLSYFHANSSKQCINGRLEHIIMNNTNSSSNASEKDAYLYSAIFNACLVFVAVLILLLGTREKKLSTYNYSPNNTTKIKLRPKTILRAMLYRPYAVLLLVYMLNWLGIQVVVGNYALFLEHTLGFKESYLYMLVALVFAMILSMLPWQILMNIIGKKLTLVLGTWILIICLEIVLVVIVRDEILSYIIGIFAGVGAATFYLVHWSMLPDVVDSAYLELGVRMEEMYFGFFVFFNKFGSGIALAFSTLALKVLGYDAKACEQNDNVKIGLRIMITAVPIFLYSLSLLVLLLYPISEKKRKMVHEEILKKGLSAKPNESSLFVSSSKFVAKHNPFSVFDESLKYSRSIDASRLIKYEKETDTVNVFETIKNI